MAIDTSGNVGIGELSPAVPLHVSPGWGRLRVESTENNVWSTMELKTPEREWHTGVGGPSVFNDVKNKFYIRDHTVGAERLVIDPNGNTGIGTLFPQVKLHVEGSGYVETMIKSVNERAILALSNGIGPSHYVWTVESGVKGIPGMFGIYNRMFGQSRLEIDGNLQVYMRSLKIEGGADFSENFDVSRKYAATGVPAAPAEPEMAGMVVSIDPENPSKLKVSSRAYDRRVAGIISGAGGVKPGMVMGQEGTFADGKHPVALSGRVYVWVDATRGAIKPGGFTDQFRHPGPRDESKKPTARAGRDHRQGDDRTEEGQRAGPRARQPAMNN